MNHVSADEAAAAILETVPPAMRAIRQQMRSGRGEALSVAQFRVLLFVRRHPGTSLSPVAEHLGTSLPSASQLVERLVRAGLLDRTPAARERRRVDLRLTDAGRAILEERDARTRAWLCERLDSLTPERLDALVRALDDLRGLVADPARAGEGR